MFEKFVARTGRKLYERKFDGQLVVIVRKGVIWISDEVQKVLGNPVKYSVFSNEKEWAIKGAEEDEEGAYVAAGNGKSYTGKDRNVIRPGAFIKAYNLPEGYIYRGRLQDGMIIFSKKPSEKS